MQQKTNQSTHEHHELMLPLLPTMADTIPSGYPCSQQHGHEKSLVTELAKEASQRKFPENSYLMSC
jgi:hypothetical protein